VLADNFQQLPAIVEIVEVRDETRMSIVENVVPASRFHLPGRGTARHGARATFFSEFEAQNQCF